MENKTKKPKTFINKIKSYFTTGLIILAPTSVTIWVLLFLFTACGDQASLSRPWRIYTAINNGDKFAEPFGIAVRDEAVYVSYGNSGKILKVSGGVLTRVPLKDRPIAVLAAPTMTGVGMVSTSISR